MIGYVLCLVVLLGLWSSEAKLTGTYKIVAPTQNIEILDPATGSSATFEFAASIELKVGTDHDCVGNIMIGASSTIMCDGGKTARGQIELTGVLTDAEQRATIEVTVTIKNARGSTVDKGGTSNGDAPKPPPPTPPKPTRDVDDDCLIWDIKDSDGAEYFPPFDAMGTITFEKQRPE